jgi:uncharacterized protein with FMN-binding domain
MRRVLLALVATTAVMALLLGYKTSVRRTTPQAAASSPVSAPSAEATGGGSASTGSSGSGSGTKSATGDSVDTRWGPVQVKVTRANGKITDVEAVVYPTENPRDQEINAQALPILKQEVLAAQNAQIDMVSGATVTSTGYISSLQSALDKLNGA